MTRTKTPKQIHKQIMRILNKIAQERGRWEGRTFIGAQDVIKAHSIRNTCRRYIDNIYAANGIEDRMQGNTVKCNYIYENAATPVSVYTKRVL